MTIKKRDDNEYYVEFKDVSFKYPNLDKPEPKFCHFAQEVIYKRLTRRTVSEITPAGIASIDGMREQALHKIELLLTQVSKEDLETYIRISR